MILLLIRLKKTVCRKLFAEWETQLNDISFFEDEEQPRQPR
jgi:hypothetical protein